jgi:hypothetical protein
MTLTTTQFAVSFADELTGQGLALDDKPAFAAAFAGMLTAWLGGEDALPADTAYRLMQVMGAWNLDQLQRLDWWAGSATGGPNGDGLYPMTNAAGVATSFPCLAKLLQVTAKGDPGGLPYVFSAATADADPGPGKLRFDAAAPAEVARLYVDDVGATGGDLSGLFAGMGASTSVQKGLLVIQAGSTAAPLVFRLTGAPTAQGGYHELPVAHLAGAAAPADGASLTLLFAPSGDRGEGVLSGVGAPDPGLGIDGDAYLRLDTGDWYARAAGAWGGPIVQTEVASLLAQAVAARNAAIAAEGVTVPAAQTASDAAEAALDARDVAIEKAGDANDDRVAVGQDKADIGLWLMAFADEKAEVEGWLDQFALDKAAAEAAAVTATTKAGEAAASAASVDGPLIDSRLNALEAGQASVEASLRSDVLRLMLSLAELRLDQVGTPHGWADTFESQDGVDLAASSGEFYDGVGKSYNGLAELPRMTANNAPAGHEVAADAEDVGQGAWRAADGSNSTGFVTPTGGSAPHWWRRKMPAGYIVGTYRFRWGNYGYPMSWKLQGAASAAGPWSDLDVASGSPTPGQWTSTRIIVAPTYYEYVRIYVSDYHTAQNGQMMISEVEFTNSSPPADMDLRSVALGAYSVPTRASLIVAAASSGVITPGANLTGHVSRDDGVTWSEATLQARDTAGGFTMYEALGVDISGQPPGSDMRWRVETIAPEIIDIGAVALAWN